MNKFWEKNISLKKMQNKYFLSYYFGIFCLVCIFICGFGYTTYPELLGAGLVFLGFLVMAQSYEVFWRNEINRRMKK